MCTGADASVVKRSQASLGARGQPVTAYAAYFTLSSRWQVALMMGFGALVQKLAGYPWGRALLLRYPGLFSNGCRSPTGLVRPRFSCRGFQYLHFHI